ncbi:MAG: 16S rRNA (cytosine(967)-C(5))-methyltransferase RsmB [Gammaproteobacteria bacterium]
MPQNPRAIAARKLARIVVRGETTDQVMLREAADPLVSELVMGTLRHHFSLSASARRSLRKPMSDKDMDVFCLLLIGLYQRFHLRVPDHAAIHETVEAARQIGKPWAVPLINAILRRSMRPEQSFEHPAWLESALQNAYGSDAPSLMTANNARAPMALRINARRTTTIDYRAQLAKLGIHLDAEPVAVPGYPETPSADAEHTRIGPTAPTPLGWGPETVLLPSPIPIRDLPGHADGQVSVQDAGAQLLPALFPAPEASTRLLDACAAPGGKLFHLLERHAYRSVTAIDSSAKRVETLQAEASRLGLGTDGNPSSAPIEVRVADAMGMDWWDGRPYDHILVDAPCSGSGTLRRHPEIKVIRDPATVRTHAEVQGRLLRSLWTVLRPGGLLVYCTCSLLPEENDHVIGAFLDDDPSASVMAFTMVTGRATRFGWQLLPTDPRTDGFYFARLQKSGAIL